jgi:colanic acid/amylovoran biosynthesis glycosyltransferase
MFRLIGGAASKSNDTAEVDGDARHKAMSARRQNGRPLFPEIGIIALPYHHWDWLGNTPHHLLTHLEKYFRIVWVNPPHEWRQSIKTFATRPTRAVSAGLTIYTPEFYLPTLHRPEWLASLMFGQRLKRAHRLLTNQGCKKTILYLWRPEFARAMACVPFDLSCYHIDDEYSFSELELPIDEAERRLIGGVDQVFITSPGLFQKKGDINPHTTWIPQGVNYEAYSKPALEPPDLSVIPHPRIGYTGWIKKQLDWALISYLTRSHPDWSFVFIGPSNLHREIRPITFDVSSRPNVYFLGSKSPEELPAYTQHFDVCIMPYIVNDYTKYIYPLKLHEYLASGRPVVGSPIRSLHDFSHVIRLAQTTDEWSQGIAESLCPEARSRAQVEARRRVAREHDWDKLVTLIARTLCTRLGPTARGEFEKTSLREPRPLVYKPTEHVASNGIVALQRCDIFVGRTMNWLYDHLRFVPRYDPFVICDSLQNREEFPVLKSWRIDRESLQLRFWHRLAGARVYPVHLQRLRRLRPHILHSHFGYVAVGDLALHRALEVPWFVSFYGADAYANIRGADPVDVYARLFERATRVLALGPVMKARLERLGCPADKVTIHPLGVDVQNLPNKPRVLKPGEALQILFAGTLREKKGVQYAVKAAAIARKAGVRLQLTLVGDEQGKPGDSETKDEVFQLIKGLDLEDVVIHHPFLTFEELLSLAMRSHVFLAPSVTAADGDAEGTPFVLQQMMATGMPAIATMHTDIPYIFGEHAHLLVPERDEVAIADRIQRYADDPDSLVTDGTALRDRIRSAFDVDSCSAGLSNLYDQV